jgi:serine/threonine protein phosphatase PrpC
MPSYLITGEGAEKIGTAGPPPGLSLTDNGSTTYQLSLRRGELLLLVSDGIGQAEALTCCLQNALATPGELARNILTFGQRSGEDDATVVTVNLSRRHYEQQ